MNFDAFVADIVENNWKVFGVEVYENGKLTHHFGDTKENRYDIYSATKTIVSIATGIAYDRGIIDLQKSVLEYLPSKIVKNLQKEQKLLFEKLTIHRLLTMSVADLPFRPEGENYLDFALSCTVKKPDDRVFYYSNICTYLVCVALTTVFQTDLAKVIEEEILKPLGITGFEYGRSPEGYFYGASQMKLTVHELSKVGLLLYNKGVYEGKRILSEKYVNLATSIQQMNREGGYGYFIWKYQDGFSINGKWGQKCFCLPEQKIMVTYLSHMEENADAVRESMERYILGI